MSVNPFLMNPDDLLALINPKAAQIRKGLNQHFPENHPNGLGWIPHTTPGGLCHTKNCPDPTAYECSSDARCEECATYMSKGQTPQDKGSPFEDPETGTAAPIILKADATLADFVRVTKLHDQQNQK
jgi:hypothetical protein